jgi:hypothetical protein
LASRALRPRDLAPIPPPSDPGGDQDPPAGGRVEHDLAPVEDHHLLEQAGAASSIRLVDSSTVQGRSA